MLQVTINFYGNIFILVFHGAHFSVPFNFHHYTVCPAFCGQSLSDDRLRGVSWSSCPSYIHIDCWQYVDSTVSQMLQVNGFYRRGNVSGSTSQILYGRSQRYEASTYGKKWKRYIYFNRQSV